MAHFRGQIRGPHWGAAMDNMLIDFWRKHECLFNSSLDTYYDKDLKIKLWAEFALSIGKPVSDVERRARSLRTQYGRVLWHPERVSTFQQRMLREKLAFLSPYISRRRGDSFLEGDKFDGEEGEEDEELETEGDQDLGSVYGSPLGADATGKDQEEGLLSMASTSDLPLLHCPNPQPQETVVMTPSCDSHDPEESSDLPSRPATPNALKYDILNQFAEIVLADMRQIRDPMVLMRLRRDITDLVFKAVEDDVERRCTQASYVGGGGGGGGGAQWQGSARAPNPCSQTAFSWRQRLLRRRNNRGSEVARRAQRWEDMARRRSHSLQPTRLSQTRDGMNESFSVQTTQTSLMKAEMEPHLIKVEEETLPGV